MADKIQKLFPIERQGDEVVINTSVVDRDHDRVFPDGAYLENFMRNPVLLWGHNYREPWAVIGRANVRQENDALVMTPEFREPASDNDPMHIIRALWEGNFIRAASIGFRPLEPPVENEYGGRDFRRWELLEVSLVPVPANQEALRRMVKSLNKDESETEIKRAIPYRRRPLAPEDMRWDGSAQVRQADVRVLRIICAWYDESNPDVKSSYKLPHHLAESPYMTVWRGVRAAMAALFGARGGVNIPQEDRRPVYRHLARHYEDFGKEPPEFRDYSEEELKQLFPEFYGDTLAAAAYLRYLAAHIEADVVEEGKMPEETVEDVTLPEDILAELQQALKILKEMEV